MRPIRKIGFGALLLASAAMAQTASGPSGQLSQPDIQLGPVLPNPHVPQVEGPGTCICTMQYDPVCAALNGERRTYPNACHAHCVRAVVVHRGPC